MFLTCLPHGVSRCLRCEDTAFAATTSWSSDGSWCCPSSMGNGPTSRPWPVMTPEPLAYQHDRHLLCAAYWYTKTWLCWCAEHALQAFPSPMMGLSIS